MADPKEWFLVEVDLGNGWVLDYEGLSPAEAFLRWHNFRTNGYHVRMTSERRPS